MGGLSRTDGRPLFKIKLVYRSISKYDINTAYHMARRHTPRRDPVHGWIYSKLKDVLEECGLHTLEEYILVCWQTIVVYMVICLILTECRHGEPKRGAVQHRWWWEQQMDLAVDNAIGLGMQWSRVCPIWWWGSNKSKGTIGLLARGCLCRHLCALLFLFPVESTSVGYTTMVYWVCHSLVLILVVKILGRGACPVGFGKP